ncbi:MAG TPA: outer membrane beta-barrel protein [Rhizomicrobium sp.]|nr:outer membrane beta-barrel protein [Rhizomicrobium sp.]
MRGIYAALIVAGATLVPVSVNAGPIDWYAAIDAGYHFTDQIDATARNTGLVWTWNSDNGWDGFARFGAWIAPDWRVEVEGGYRGGDIKSVIAQTIEFPSVDPSSNIADIPLTNLHGGMHAKTLMVNAFYDADLDAPIRPFVGAGVGVLRADVNAGGTVTVCVEVCLLETLTSGHGSTNFAWQAIAGASWPLSDRVDLQASYRYLRSEGVEWDSMVDPDIAAPGRFRGDYSDSSVSVGVQFALAP